MTIYINLIKAARFIFEWTKIWEEIKQTHKRRGPDYQSEKVIQINLEFSLRLYSSVLSIRGDSITCQPLEIVDSGDYLQFNGEIFRPEDQFGWRSEYSDTKILGDLISRSANDCAKNHHEAICLLLSNLDGPWSFVYYQSKNQRLFFGRDVLGRRSLVINKIKCEKDQFVIAQTCCGYYEWEEVPSGEVYMLEISSVQFNIFEAYKTCMNNSLKLITRPEFNNTNEVTLGLFHSLNTKSLLKINTSMPLHPNIETLRKLTTLREKYDSGYYDLALNTLDTFLRKSILARTISLPKKSFEREPRVVVCFSGGLDCTCICALLHFYLPPNETIELINVSFAEERAPDRKSALDGYKELKTVYNTRKWDFIKVDVCKEDCVKMIDKIEALCHPNNSPLDKSLALAFWFASRAQGILESTGNHYHTKAKVLFSGLGADEIFGGYNRHISAYQKGSWDHLIKEMQLDLDRLPVRNLGRDDRLVSDNGRELRLPYLDDSFIRNMSLIPIHLKTDPGLDRTIGPKLLLRIYCSEVLKLPKSALRIKRAIQFGTRSARIYPTLKNN